MRSLANSAGVRIVDKSFFEKRIKQAVNGVVKQSVSDAGFMDMPSLRVIDIKTAVSAMSINFVYQIIMQCYNIIKQIAGKFLDILF